MKKILILIKCLMLCSCHNSENNRELDVLTRNIDYCITCNSLEEAVKNPDSAKYLYLNDIYEASIDSLSTLRNLKLLQINRGHNINTLKLFSYLEKIDSLETLNIISCNIKTIDKNIYNLKELKELNILHDTIIKVSNKLYELKKLNTLSITTKTLSDSIMLLMNLKCININVIGASVFPGKFQYPLNLEDITIPKETITITNELSLFKKLNRIDISGSNFENQLLEYLYSNDSSIKSKYENRLLSLKKLLPPNCIIVSSGNIKR